MTSLEFLQSDLLKTPIIREEEDFSQFSTHFLQTFLGRLKGVEGDLGAAMKDRIPINQALVYKLIHTLESYYLGNVPRAYRSFSDGLSLIRQYLWLDDANVTVYHDEKTEKVLEEHFFKARMPNGNPFSKRDMFIRPFEQREHINTYRYSIPGLPCLYLSSNIYTAWHELGCPDINVLQVSRFLLDKSLKRLRFGFTIDFWNRGGNIEDNYYRGKLYDYLTYFPLHAICNVKVRSPSLPFKPEYIFPQLLMQWIKEEHQIDMVEYSSTKIDFKQAENSIFPYNFRNMAIPAQTSDGKGVCSQLRAKIKLTDPLSWQQLQSSYPKGNIPLKEDQTTSILRVMRNMTRLNLIAGKPVWYKDSIFGLMEDYMLDEMEPLFIH